MAELKLVYSQLEDVSKNATKVSEDCDDYKIELSQKLTNNWLSVPKSPLSTGNTRINNASYYVKQKNKKLEEKRIAYKNFANDVDDLIDKAKTADKAVAKSVNGSREAFLKEHTNLQGDGWAAFFANLVVDVPVIGWIAKKISEHIEGWKNLITNLKYWYEVCGGKEIIETVLAVATVVLEVVGLVVATIAFLGASTFGAAFVALAGLIAACIGLVNAIVNLGEQIKANKETDPAWAKHYGDTDSYADWLRKTTFGNKLDNWGEGLANALEITETVCNIINIADGIGKLYKRSGIGKVFKRNGVIKTITSKKGWSEIGKTIKVSWKALVFGDGGGVEGWAKRWKRAFTSQNTDGAKRISKIAKVFKKDFGKLTNVVKTVDSIMDTISNGFDFDSIYKPGKIIYSTSGNDGIIKSGFDVTDFIRKCYS